MRLNSPDFNEGQSIPKRFSGEGDNQSPALTWSGAPPGTRSFAIVCEDPDAPIGPAGMDHPFVHWIAYDISSFTSELPAGLPTSEALDSPTRLRQGRNSFGRMGYGGPMPPVGGGPHRYFFTLYALGTHPAVPAGATRTELLAAIHPHILAEADLKGVFERPEKGAKPIQRILRSPQAPGPESRPAP